MKNSRENLAIRFFGLQLLLAGVQSIETSQCIAPLGMEHGLIKDEDITASSSFDHENVGPHHGRIRNDLNGGAWCPQAEATPETKEWIEIDLHTVHMVTAAETQGRFGNGLGVEFTESYVLEYFRPRLNKWVRYRSKSNGHLLKGNVNTYLAEKSLLNPPIWASRIRFLPYSPLKRTVCMRVEVYGCKWSDGIVSYTMPQGDKRGTSWEFYDFAYDGHWDGDMLKYGLGQLVDGETAPDDFKVPFHQDNLQSWIGWKNDSRNYQPVEIVFEFDNLREFRTVHLFMNNQFTREVEVFSVVKLFFSADGKQYRGDPIRYEYIQDRIFENARNVTIKLYHRIGRYVKLQLHFASRWMLLSEVSFESSLISGNFTEGDDEEDTNTDAVTNQTLIRRAEKVNVPVVNKEPGSFGPYLVIIVVFLVLLIMLMVVMVLYVIVQHRKYKNLQRPSQIADKTVLYGMPQIDIVNMPSDFDPDMQDVEYAVPLQTTYTSPNDTIRKTSTSSSEQHYASVDICKPEFIPPPPPISSPQSSRMKSPPRYVIDNTTYIGP